MDPSTDLLFEPLTLDLECRSYLVASRSLREAMLVDPLEDRVPEALERLRALGLGLAFALDTHTHADHLSGSRTLVERLGGKTAGSPRGSVDLPLGDGDVLTLGALAFTVWSTPGHTADSLCLVMHDRVLVGDTLLIGATGRTDLPTGDAEQEWDSLQRLLTLPDELLVFPGHDYAQQTQSTIGVERRENKRLLLGRGAFIAAMHEPRKTKPALLAQAIAHNTRPLKHRAVS